VTQLVWDAVGERIHEQGVDRGVLYIDTAGFPWNGLVSVEEAPTGGEARPFYIDGVKYLNLAAKEEFAATISAFYSPVHFDQCEGIGDLVPGFSAGQQRRKPFGLSYRTLLGNDVMGTDYGYKIHLIYNALVAPASRTYETQSDSPEAAPLSWPVTTKPIAINGMAHSAHFVIDSTKVTTQALREIEKALYGSSSTNPYLPTPTQIIEILTTADIFKVVDLGGGEFLISGPNESVREASPGIYTINHDTAVVLNADGAVITST
jgi:hypothetical protein